ncbi:GATOR1 complex protein NPRL3-like [Hydra vulgaris]|uniref:GATOR complex protein NPRL3 n=1 Tax=Hydra vulgaris TaxID=6087 RepID=A0ABM4BW54_HYDVU
MLSLFEREDTREILPMNENTPISILLVVSGSRGERLLYRYPFNDPCCEHVQTNKNNLKSSFKSPYARVKSPHVALSQTHFLQNGELYGFSDVLLATLLVPKIVETNFEVKIDKLKLVGYPVLMTGYEDNAFEDCVIEDDHPLNEDVTNKIIHVVFALHSNTDDFVVKHYQNICRMIGKALRHEEKRCRYFSTQREIMLAQRECSEKISDVELNPFESILKESELARVLTEVFECMCSGGVLNTKLNKWINLSYSLPHMVHSGKKTMIKELKFIQYMQGIKPYHTMLLLDESGRDNLISFLPIDASPVLKRLIKHSSPVKNFQTLSQDADISLPQIFQVVAHLVYWGKCTVIYPLAESNVYILSEDAPTAKDSKAAEEFAKVFQEHSLHKVLAIFSSPTSLGDYRNIRCNQQQSEQAQIVKWMLIHGILKQLHTYVIILPVNENFISDDKKSKELIEIAKRYLKKNEISIFSNFTVAEKMGFLQLVEVVDKEDLVFFLNMSKYFRGEHHLEDIMYYENVPRSKLLTLIDKFRSMLLTVDHEDSALL